MKIQERVEQLRDGYLAGINRSYENRRNHLIQLRELVVNHESQLCDAIKKDFNKPFNEAFITEIFTVISEIDVHLKNLKKWMSPERVGTSITTFPSKNKIYKQPYGTVCIIGAWNYPVHLSLMPLIGAISAGNTLVLKPSELAPHTSAILSELMNDTFDPSFLTVVEGGVPETELLLKQKLDKIFFTGSTRVGKIIMKAASENLTPVTLELGGKSPAIVHHDANISVAAKRIWWGKVFNAGQTCVAPDYVVVHESVAELFIEESKNVLSDFFKNDFIIGENYCSIVNKSHYQRLVDLLNDSKIVHGGSFNSETLFIEPTLIDAAWDDKIMEDEIFGPLLPIITYNSEDECMDHLIQMGKPLALYLFTENSSFETAVISSVPFGGGCINETITHLSNHNLPFGGVGESGMGSYHGLFSFETFSRKQGVLKKGTWPDPEFRYPPYDSKSINWLKRYIK